MIPLRLSNPALHRAFSVKVPKSRSAPKKQGGPSLIDALMKNVEKEKVKLKKAEKAERKWLPAENSFEKVDFRPRSTLRDPKTIEDLGREARRVTNKTSRRIKKSTEFQQSEQTFAMSEVKLRPYIDESLRGLLNNTDRSLPRFPSYLREEVSKNCQDKIYDLIAGLPIETITRMKSDEGFYRYMVGKSIQFIVLPIAEKLCRTDEEKVDLLSPGIPAVGEDILLPDFPEKARVYSKKLVSDERGHSMAEIVIQFQDGQRLPSARTTLYEELKRTFDPSNDVNELSQKQELDKLIKQYKKEFGSTKIDI